MHRKVRFVMGLSRRDAKITLYFEMQVTESPGVTIKKFDWNWGNIFVRRE